MQFSDHGANAVLNHGDPCRSGVRLDHLHDVAGTYRCLGGLGVRADRGLRWLLGLAALIGLVALACRREDSSGSASRTSGQETAWFQEVAAKMHVEFTHVPFIVQRYYLPEIMCGGVALFDFDGDGYLDIYFVQGGDLDPATPNRPGNRLYRNRGDATFEDVTASAGVGDTGYGMGCACGDYDRDGDIDLYVTNVGPNVLYRNNGDGTFTDVTSFAGVGDSQWGASSAFVDYDGDLDLFLSHLHGESNTFYLNEGGLFDDVTAQVGLAVPSLPFTGFGLSFVDFDHDGNLDLFVANGGSGVWCRRSTATARATIRAFILDWVTRARSMRFWCAGPVGGVNGSGLFPQGKCTSLKKAPEGPPKGDDTAHRPWARWIVVRDPARPLRAWSASDGSTPRARAWGSDHQCTVAYGLTGAGDDRRW